MNGTAMSDQGNEASAGEDEALPKSSADKPVPFPAELLPVRQSVQVGWLMHNLGSVCQCGR